MPTEESQDEILGKDPGETQDKKGPLTALEEAEALLGSPAEEPAQDETVDSEQALEPDEVQHEAVEPAEDEEAEAPDESDDPDTEAVEAGEEPEASESVQARQDEADEDEDAETEPEDQYSELLLTPDDGIKRRWYAIHAYSGQEGAVMKNLAVHAEQAGLSDLLGGVLVPMEEVAEIKSGEKRISKRKFFPGYVLVRLPEHPEHNPELWHMIKETPGVSGFIGSRSVPVPLEDEEVKAIIEEMRGERERPKPKVEFEESERVKIIDGPFSNFLGNIDKINHERGTLKIMVEIFERLTSVEVEFWQVEKM